jgi:hypothetical protein
VSAPDDGGHAPGRIARLDGFVLDHVFQPLADFAAREIGVTCYALAARLLEVTTVVGVVVFALLLSGGSIDKIAVAVVAPIAGIAAPLLHSALSQADRNMKSGLARDAVPDFMGVLGAVRRFGLLMLIPQLAVPLVFLAVRQATPLNGPLTIAAFSGNLLFVACVCMASVRPLPPGTGLADRIARLVAGSASINP